VTVSTSCNQPPPQHGNLAVNPTSLDLGNYCGDSFSGVGITLSNTGNGPLTWSSPGGSGMGLSPANGSLSAGQAVSVGVSGTKANGSIPINWQDGGSGPPNTVTVSTSCNNAPPPPPQLYVQNLSVQLLGACGTSVTDNIGNTGGQPLDWSATTDDSAISVSPTGGTIAPGLTNIPITISASSSANINQPGHVYITSNGGTATITINWGGCIL
jgi:hypothetical protein